MLGNKIEENWVFGHMTWESGAVCRSKNWESREKLANVQDGWGILGNRVAKIIWNK